MSQLVYQTQPIPGVASQHRATIIVGEIVGLAPGASVKVRLTHSHHPRYRVGKSYLFCSKRLKRAFISGDSVYDEATLVEITPQPIDGDGKTKS